MGRQREVRHDRRADGPLRDRPHGDSRQEVRAPLSSQILDVALDERVAHGTRATLRLGDDETPATTSWLGGPFHQLRCERPVEAARGQRLALDGVGGVVLDPSAPRHGTGNEHLVRLRALLDGRDVPPVLDEDAVTDLDARLREAGLGGVAGADPEGLAFLVEAGRAVRLKEDLHVHARAFARAEERVRGLLASDGSITAAGLADDLGVAPDRAQLLLDRLDAERVTTREGDAHVLRRRGA